MSAPEYEVLLDCVRRAVKAQGLGAMAENYIEPYIPGVTTVILELLHERGYKILRPQNDNKD